MITPAANSSITAVRGTLIFCRDDPFLTDPSEAFVCEPDGVVICRDGVIQSVGLTLN
jgi:guanine deaminase